LAKNDSVGYFRKGRKSSTSSFVMRVFTVIWYVSLSIKEHGWIGVVTNDAWWRETAGYQQHYSYSRLRAIETRKWVARSANTGTSAFIDPKGNEYQHSEWFKKVCFNSNHIFESF